jgi:hypothetical protein
MDLGSINGGNFLTGWITLTLWRKTLLHGVLYTHTRARARTRTHTYIHTYIHTHTHTHTYIHTYIYTHTHIGQIKEGEMGGTWNIQGKDEKCIKWRPLVNTVVKPRVPENSGNFWTTWTTIGFYK